MFADLLIKYSFGFVFALLIMQSVHMEMMNGLCWILKGTACILYSKYELEIIERKMKCKKQNEYFADIRISR